MFQEAETAARARVVVMWASVGLFMMRLSSYWMVGQRDIRIDSSRIGRWKRVHSVKNDVWLFVCVDSSDPSTRLRYSSTTMMYKHSEQLRIFGYVLCMQTKMSKQVSRCSEMIDQMLQH